MAPKKKVSIKQKPLTIQQDFIHHLPSTFMDAALDASSLSAEQVARAYGLTSVHHSPLYPACHNKYSLEPAPPSPERIPQVIVISDSDDDPVLAKKKAVKSKGKQKAEVVVVKPQSHLDTPCSLEKCGDNPKCLNWLGQATWEKPKKTLSAFYKAAGIGNDPGNPRQDGVPVGMRNLGATCYVNSFLQVWYQDETFRAGVYACQPPADGNIEASPLYQLQVLFTFLQTAQQAVYNPISLVTSLKLDTGEQQDAQEFSKLFLNLLDHEFQKQGSRAAQDGSPDVSKLVEDQFEGQMTYGTRCSKCKNKSERHSKFTEMEVNLTKDCKLEDRIRESLKEEEMSGDNRYHCDKCEKKRDAMRYTVLDTLPPVLHFSLLRFVFSAKDFQRSKSTHAISYPLKLDMGQYFPPDENGDQPSLWYDLKGVLMHKGTSAHHGHYVAQVYDTMQKKWFLFDDDTVTPIDDLNAPDRYDEDDEDDSDPIASTSKPISTSKPASKSAPVKSANGFSRDKNGVVLPKSKDAYMLIYTRRKDNNDSDVVERRNDPVPPPLARAKVEELDQQHDESVLEFEAKSALVKAQFEKIQEEKRSVYRVWDVQEENEESFLVSKADLRRWIEEGSQPVVEPPSLKIKLTIPPRQASLSCKPEVESSGLIQGVPNGRLDVGEDTEMEVIPSSDPESDSKLPSSPTPRTNGHTNGQTNGDRAVSVELREADDENAMLIDSPNDITSLNIVCVHGAVDPMLAKSMKRISQLGVMALKDLGVSLVPELTTEQSLCSQCVWSIALERNYVVEHPKQVAMFQDARATESDYWISKSWLNDWMTLSPKMHRANLPDPDPNSDDYINDVLCEHGDLVPAKTRADISRASGNILQSIFQSWDPIQINRKTCSICSSAVASNKQSITALKAIATKEKSTLKSFTDQMTLIGVGLIVAERVTYYIVPSTWSKQWLSWNKNKFGSSERPGQLDNSVFICEHGKVSIDIESEVENPSRIQIVSSAAEWNFLKDHAIYKAGPPIKLSLKDGIHCTIPSICHDCVEFQRHNFTTTELLIKVLSPSDFCEDGNRKPIEIPSSPDEAASTSSKRKSTPLPMAPMNLGGAPRQSKRIRNMPAKELQKSSQKIEMAKEDTVKDLKIKINDKMSIPTIYQRLFYNGRELESQETVVELGLCGGEYLELLEMKMDDEDVELSKLDDSIDEVERERNRKGGRKGRVEGFGGTGLMGFTYSTATTAAAVSSAATSAAVSEGDVEMKDPRRSAENGNAEASGSGSSRNQDEISCPRCTVIQSVYNKVCEVCDNSLA